MNPTDSPVGTPEQVCMSGDLSDQSDRSQMIVPCRDLSHTAAFLPTGECISLFPRRRSQTGPGHIAVLYSGPAGIPVSVRLYGDASSPTACSAAPSVFTLSHAASRGTFKRPIPARYKLFAELLPNC